MSPLPIVICPMCGKPAIAEATEVTFHRSDAKGTIGATVRQAVASCEMHMPEVAFRLAWNIYYKHIVPAMQERGMEPPESWCVDFGDGKVFSGPVLQFEGSA